MLCSVAFLTVVPPIKTGASIATGVSLPVRPTCTRISSSLSNPSPRRILISNRPARSFPREPQFVLQRSAIHFHDDAVNLIRQRFALPRPLLDERPHFLHAVDQFTILIHLETRRLKRAQRLPMTIEVSAPVLQQHVGKIVQPSFRRNFGSSCRTVPAVALRGLANEESPLLSRSSFILLNAASGISNSPRTSKSAGMPAFFSFSFEIESGTDRTVRTLSVTSSPTLPSPRVIPRTSFPSS